jgi:hypothetical protein
VLPNRFYLVAVAAVCLGFGAGTAHAATLSVEDRVVYVPPGGARVDHDVVYVAGAERNRVVIGGARPLSVVVYDPGVPMPPAPSPPSPPSGPPPVPSPGLPSDPFALLDSVLAGDILPVDQVFACVAPTGKSVGVCVATPGRTCDSGFSDICSTDIGTFYRVEIDLGDGSDSLRLAQGTVRTVVATGRGNDKIDSHNGAVDQVDCGDGFDTVAAEYRDVVSSTCEAVTRGPGL